MNDDRGPTAVSNKLMKYGIFACGAVMLLLVTRIVFVGGIFDKLTMCQLDLG